MKSTSVREREEEKKRATCRIAVRSGRRVGSEGKRRKETREGLESRSPFPVSMISTVARYYRLVSLFENADLCAEQREPPRLGESCDLPTRGLSALWTPSEIIPRLRWSRRYSRSRDRFNPRSRQADVDDASDRLSDRLSVVLS